MCLPQRVDVCGTRRAAPNRDASPGTEQSCVRARRESAADAYERDQPLRSVFPESSGAWLAEMPTTAADALPLLLPP